jgi:hypothetical protein
MCQDQKYKITKKNLSKISYISQCHMRVPIKIIPSYQRHYAVMTVHLQGSDSELAELMPIFFCSEISRALLGGEHKLLVSFILRLIYF